MERLTRLRLSFVIMFFSGVIIFMVTYWLPISLVSFLIFFILCQLQYTISDSRELEKIGN